jgi:Sulfotransferase domain
MENKNIVWLASYPKSGNTWFRSFLSSLLHEKVVDINEIDEGKIFSRRNVFETTLDIDSTLLDPEEVKNLQPQVFTYLNQKSSDKLNFKIHDAFVSNKNNIPIVPEESTFAAIYFVRNPLDVAISFTNHNASTTDKTIENMANTNFLLGSETGFQFQQPLLTWSEHFESWTTKPNFPVHVLRYEDMLTDTFNVFKNVIQKIGLDYTDEAIQKAIDATSFEKLKKQEEENGFNEKNPNSLKFFNNGKSGTWRGVLTDEQINKIKSNHGETMKKLGYL